MKLITIDPLLFVQFLIERHRRKWSTLNDARGLILRPALVVMKNTQNYSYSLPAGCENNKICAKWLALVQEYLRHIYIYSEK